jgi:hypothetical protein
MLGHGLAGMTRFIHNASDGKTYPTVAQHRPVHVDISAGYFDINGILKAIECNLCYRPPQSLAYTDRTPTPPVKGSSVEVP